MPEIFGHCDPAFAAVREAFAGGFAERGKVGAAVAAYADGRLVVDLWGGFADPDEELPWQRDTIAHVYSVSKPFVAACALLLVERGLLELDAPVGTYWPEYACVGKERTLVRHVLAQQAGLVRLRDPQPGEVLLEWDRLVRLLEAEPPSWEPGTRHGEHALFFGHLVGELVRRVDGRRIGQFFAEQIAAPWQLDFHFGLAPADRRRCARLVDDGGAWRRSILDDPRPLFVEALNNPPGILDVDVVNSAAYRAAEVPAVNGHGSARAIASFYGGLSSGGALSGVRLVDEATVDEALEPQRNERDELLENEVSWGLGMQTYPSDGYFGLGGIGGFAGFGIRRAGISAGFGYITCRLGTHERGNACADAFERSLEQKTSTR